MRAPAYPTSSHLLPAAQFCWSKSKACCCLQRKRIPIEHVQIEAAMAAEGDAAVEVLQSIYSFIHSPSYE